MNYFTKEELEFILDGTRHWCNKNVPTPWIFEFKKKVESMIDNYCDHQSNGELIVLSAHPYLDAYKCNKCEKLYK